MSETTKDLSGKTGLGESENMTIHIKNSGASTPYLSLDGLSAFAQYNDTTKQWDVNSPDAKIEINNQSVTHQDFMDLNATTVDQNIISVINDDPTLKDNYTNLNTFQPFQTFQQTSATTNPEDSTPVQPGDSTTADEATTSPPSITQIQDFEGTGDPDAGRDLRYPFDHTSAYDFIKIFPMKYIPAIQNGNVNTLTQGGSASSHFSQVGRRYQHAEKAGSMVFLPMIPASESSSTGWGKGDEMNAIQKQFGIAATEIIGDALTNQKDIIDWGIKAGNTLVGAAGALLKSSGLGQFITAHFAGKAVGSNILGRSGVAINPNLELLFSGPSLREFGYQFTFTPRSKKETQEVRDIIKVFKKGMAPRRTEQHMFLNVPHVWNVEYVYNSQGSSESWQHPYLNKIKPCALKSFTVDYMPAGSYMTYSDGSMTSYQVTMSFGELEPIYNNDIDMNSNDMGY